MTNEEKKQTAKRKKNKKRKALEKYYADSRLCKWEQKKRVEWDLFHGNPVPKD